MNGKNFYLSEEYMQKNTAANAAAAAHAAPKTCAAHGKKTLTRVSIFSPWRNKMVSVKPYGPTAKKLYKFYIHELGYDAAWIAPYPHHLHDSHNDYPLRYSQTRTPSC